MSDHAIFADRRGARAAFALVAFGLVCLIALYLPVMGTDNTAARYQDMTTGPASWTYYFSYRYIPGWINAGLLQLHRRYYDYAYLWTVLFALAISWAVYEFSRLLRLPISFFPFVLAAVGLHGYLTDNYQFSMIFAGYGISMLGAAVALRALNCRSSLACVGLGAIGGLISMISYQPFAFIAPVAVCLILVRNSLLRGARMSTGTLPVIEGPWHPTSPWSPLLRGGVGFVVAMILFVICRHLLSGDGGRATTPTWPNFEQYLQFIISPNPKGAFFATPIHERLIYEGCTAVLALTILVRAIIKRRTTDRLALLAILGLFLMMPDPFNLMSATFWPSPRSITAAVIFQVGAAALLASLAPIAWRPAMGCVAVLLLIISGSNQVQNLQTQMQQLGRDGGAVLAITAEIEQTTLATKQTKLAVKSSWQSLGYLPGGVSSFIAPWSNSALFAILTGKFTPANVPPGACGAPLSGPWRIERVADVTVICMK